MKTARVALSVRKEKSSSFSETPWLTRAKASPQAAVEECVGDVWLAWAGSAALWLADNVPILLSQSTTHHSLQSPTTSTTSINGYSIRWIEIFTSEITLMKKGMFYSEKKIKMSDPISRMRLLATELSKSTKEQKIWFSLNRSQHRSFLLKTRVHFGGLTVPLHFTEDSRLMSVCSSLSLVSIALPVPWHTIAHWLGRTNLSWLR